MSTHPKKFSSLVFFRSMWRKSFIAKTFPPFLGDLNRVDFVFCDYPQVRQEIRILG
jgi:hypothetical protein